MHTSIGRHSLALCANSLPCVRTACHWTRSNDNRKYNDKYHPEAYSSGTVLAFLRYCELFISLLKTSVWVVRNEQGSNGRKPRGVGLWGWVSPPNFGGSKTRRCQIFYILVLKSPVLVRFVSNLNAARRSKDWAELTPRGPAIKAARASVKTAKELNPLNTLSTRALLKLDCVLVCRTVDAGEEIESRLILETDAAVYTSITRLWPHNAVITFSSNIQRTSVFYVSYNSVETLCINGRMFLTKNKKMTLPTSGISLPQQRV